MQIDAYDNRPIKKPHVSYKLHFSCYSLVLINTSVSYLHCFTPRQSSTFSTSFTTRASSV